MRRAARTEYLRNHTRMTERQTDQWGIDRFYQDAFGKWQATPEESRLAILKAMQAEDEDTGPGAEAPVLFLRPGHPTCVIEAGELQLETGEKLPVTGAMPANLPL